METEKLLPQPGYIEQEIQFASTDQDNNNIKISGTLTLPKNGKNFPAIVFIAGAGP